MADRKVIEKVNDLLRKQMVQKFGVFVLAMAVIGSVAYFGTHRNQGSFAASVGILSMSTSVGSSAAVVGSNVTVTLNEDSGTDVINAVQAAITYDTAKLQYVSMTQSSAFSSCPAVSTSTPGVFRISCSTATGAPGISGSNSIVTLTFKVLGNSGTTPLTYDQPFSFIVRASDNVNILTSVNNASIAMKLPAPTITSIAPTSGPTAGGTAVTITGSNYVSGSSVTFGGAPSMNITVNSATSITATAPVHAAGAASVVVTNPDSQSATLSNAFTYVAPAPTVSSVSPSSGLIAGGTSVTITGADFVSGATVTIGGTAATGVVFNNNASLTAVTPAHAAGLVDVVVKNPDNQSGTKTGAFTYTNPAPTISSLSPSSGSTAGGTRVTITGTNYISGATVTFGGTAGTSITFVSATSLQVTTPARAAGVTDVIVRNPDTQSATKQAAFTYVNPAPSVGSIAPTSGSISGGTTVTVTGGNFISGVTVKVGGVAAGSVTFVSPTQITIITPAGTPGPKPVAVTNPDGQGGNSNVTFNYLSNPGDANNDGRVNAIDLSVLVSHDGENYPSADFNGDGTVGSADMAILIGKWTW